MSAGSFHSQDPWTAAMLAGDFETAWRVCDRVLAERLARNEACWEWPRHQQFIWRGQQLARRRVLVRCYHGLGDTLQFVRFAAPLRQIAREVTLWVQPSLMSIVATAPGVDRVSPLHEGTPELLYDTDIEIMELPHALRVTLDQIGSYVPYLKPRMRSRLPETSAPDALRVGVAWRSGDWAPERGMDPRELSALRDIPGVELYSLQYEATREERAEAGVIDFSCKDIELLASRMRQLDLIISVDTYTAHLAGAMGLPTWTLLPTTSDWRWMRNRDDTPWYPGMRLFRQLQAGDWHSVMVSVRENLEGLAEAAQTARLMPRYGFSQHKGRGDTL